VSSYAFGKTLAADFQVVVDRVTQALANEGFVVLTDIDVAATMKKKLGEEMRPFRILGACNPQLAHRAITAEPQIGTLLPCNVVVREDATGKVQVEFMDPNAVLRLVNRAEVTAVAGEVRQKLQRVCDAI
jgi:uncharacterized protein (DUF302 family)